jgi:hypothetical protein
VKRAALALAAAACNAVLDLDEATPLASDRPPTCEAGWRFRRPVDIDNRSGRKLIDWQVAIVLDTISPILAARMHPFLHDLRPTLADGVTELPYWIEKDVATTATTIWTKLPFLVVGTTRILLHHGNPWAEARGGSPHEIFLDDIVGHDFDEPGGWTVSPPRPEPSRWAATWPTASGWVRSGQGVLFVDLEQDSPIATSIVLALQRDVTFPPGSEYRMRFDVRVLAASTSDWTPVARWLVSPGQARFNEHWIFEQRAANATGIHLAQETAEIEPGTRRLAFTVSLPLAGGYFKAELDHLRVRRYVSPEPVVTVGPEQSNCP